MELCYTPYAVTNRNDELTKLSMLTTLTEFIYKSDINLYYLKKSSKLI